MKGIIIGILAFISILLLRTKQALGFTDVNINTATFDGAQTIPEYKDPGTRQWGQKMANNVATAYRLGGMNMLINYELIPDGSTKVFDTERDYRNKYIYIRGMSGSACKELPFKFLEDHDWDTSLYGTWYNNLLTKLTTTEQVLAGVVLKIKALNTGGFAIKNVAGSYGDIRVTYIVSELRLVAAE